MWTVHTPLTNMFLFGEVGFREWDTCLPVGGLIGLVALGIWAITKVKRWRDEADEIRGLPADQQIAHYEQMVKDGQLSPEELARIKAQLAARFEPQAANSQQAPPPPNPPPDTSIQEK